MIKFRIKSFFKVLAFSVLISFIGCNEDETPHNIFNLPFSVITTNYAQGGGTNQSYYKYDSNQLIQIIRGSETTDFKYENSRLVRINVSFENHGLYRYTELDYYDNGKLRQSIEYILDSDFATKFLYEYDSNNVITKRYTGNSISQTENELVSYQLIENGNLIKILDPSDQDLEIIYKYDQNPNPFQNLHQLEVFQRILSFNKNNLTNIEYRYSGEIIDYYNYEYLYNSEGIPKSVKLYKEELLSQYEYYY